MRKNSESDRVKFLSNWQDNHKYFDMLRLLASLSRLFSENTVPYLDYRLAENLFCKYFMAVNDARSCTAYDARLGALGVGIKTFILKNGSDSIEKVAEFNKLSDTLKDLSGVDLAYKLGEYRNARIQFADDTFGVNSSVYHIVGRMEGNLRLFNCNYDKISLGNIRVLKDSKKGFEFSDGLNNYIFNRSKSVLMKRFSVKSNYKDLPVEIMENPLDFLEQASHCVQPQILMPKKKGVDYVVLPLYTTRTRTVPEKSGLNQWNAGGRKRNENEVYISVPAMIHQKWPKFFPGRDQQFRLQLPDGKYLYAKICQDGAKALMSNPNSALGEWILRKVLKKGVGELVTMLDLDLVGIDSVIINKLHKKDPDGVEIFSISFSDDYESYEDFLM